MTITLTDHLLTPHEILLMTIILTDHLLTPHDDLRETALYNTNSPWFADGSLFFKLY